MSVPAQEVLKFSPCQFVFIPNLKKLYEWITIVGFAVNIRVALFVKARQKVKTNISIYRGNTHSVIFLANFKQTFKKTW